MRRNRIRVPTNRAEKPAWNPERGVWHCPLCGYAHTCKLKALWHCQTPAAEDPRWDGLVADALARRGVA